MLHLYLELKEKGFLNGYSNNGLPSSQKIATGIHERLKALGEDYADVEAMLGLNPLKVTLLPPGTFRRYTAGQRASGADLVHLKPPHVKPSDKVLSSLLECASAAVDLDGAELLQPLATSRD